MVLYTIQSCYSLYIRSGINSFDVHQRSYSPDSCMATTCTYPSWGILSNQCGSVLIPPSYHCHIYFCFAKRECSGFWSHYLLVRIQPQKPPGYIPISKHVFFMYTCLLVQCHVSVLHLFTHTILTILCHLISAPGLFPGHLFF